MDKVIRILVANRPRVMRELLLATRTRMLWNKSLAMIAMILGLSFLGQTSPKSSDQDSTPAEEPAYSIVLTGSPSPFGWNHQSFSAWATSLEFYASVEKENRKPKNDATELTLLTPAVHDRRNSIRRVQPILIDCLHATLSRARNDRARRG